MAGSRREHLDETIEDIARNSQDPEALHHTATHIRTLEALLKLDPKDEDARRRLNFLRPRLHSARQHNRHRES